MQQLSKGFLNQCWYEKIAVWLVWCD